MVNTFLVCRDFAKSAALLDSRRLNKQCTEAKQIIDALARMSSESSSTDKENKESKEKRIVIGFRNHPAVLQWRGYEDALKYYFNVHRAEALKREIKITASCYTDLGPGGEIKTPWFVNCPHYWYSHCASLYRKQRWTYEGTSNFPPIYLAYGYFGHQELISRK